MLEGVAQYGVELVLWEYVSVVIVGGQSDPVLFGELLQVLHINCHRKRAWHYYTH